MSARWVRWMASAVSRSAHAARGRREVRGFRLGQLVAFSGVMVLCSAGLAVAEGPNPWDTAMPIADQTRMFQAPEFRQALADAAARDAALKARRATSGARAQRVRSRTDYRGQNRLQALSLARQTFPELLSHVTRVPLPPGSRVTRYDSPTTARIVDADGHSSLLISDEPLAAPEGGYLAPIDLSLQDAGDGFVVDNPAVPVSLPAEANRAVTLTDLGLGISVEGAAAAPGTLSDDQVFYSSVATDTDYVASATRAGAELMWQLRSADAPEQLGLNLDLPPNASVHLSSSLTDPDHGSSAGTIEVVRDGTVVATISAPVAVDADGIGVPARFRFADGKLVLEVAHRNADAHYPVMVDPAVYEVWGSPDFDNGHCGAGPTEFASRRWSTMTAGGGDWHWGCANDGIGGGGGLFVGAAAGYYYSGSYGEFLWGTPNNTYIYSAWFDGVRHIAAGSFAFGGLQGANYTWGALAAEYGDTTWTQWSLVTSSPAYSWSAHIGLMMDGSYYRGSDGMVGLHGIVLNIADNNSPTSDLHSISTPITNSDSTWVDDTNIPIWVATHGTDQGLGIRWEGVRNPNNGDVLGIDDAGCAGYLSSPCPLEWMTAGYPLNSAMLHEGDNWLQAYTQDIVDNVGFGPWWNERIDRSSPSIAASGELIDYYQGRLGSLSDNPSFTVHAYDGPDRPGGGAANSGVKRVRVMYRSEGESSWTPWQDWDFSPYGSCDSCDRGNLVASIAKSSLVGTHTVRIDAWDFLDHVATSTFTVGYYPTSVQYGNAGGTANTVDTEDERSAVSAAMAADGADAQQIFDGLTPADQQYVLAAPDAPATDGSQSFPLNCDADDGSACASGIFFIQIHTDRIHKSSYEPTAASIHVWWTQEGGRTRKATLKGQLQQHWGGTWVDTGAFGQDTVWPGGGSANWVNARALCTRYPGRVYTYRVKVNVSVPNTIGSVPPWYGGPVELDCSSLGRSL
jgi:hypothetical protein